MLDGLPELRLVEFLFLSRVTPSGTLEELHVLLICRLGIVHEEVEAVLEVSYRGCSEQVELLYRLVCEALNLLGGVPLLGEDLLPLALAEGYCHLLSPLDGVCRLGGHEGSLPGLLNDLHSKMTSEPLLLHRLLGG